MIHINKVNKTNFNLSVSGLHSHHQNQEHGPEVNTPSLTLCLNQTQYKLFEALLSNSTYKEDSVSECFISYCTQITLVIHS